MFKNRKGQSTVEYVVLVTAVVGAVLAFLLSSNSPFRATMNSTLSGTAEQVNTMSDRLVAGSAASEEGDGQNTTQVNTPLNPSTPCPEGQTRNEATNECE